jgi:hypothetical protein
MGRAQVLALYTHVADADSKTHMDRLFPLADEGKSSSGGQPDQAASDAAGQRPGGDAKSPSGDDSESMGGKTTFGN